MVFTSGADCVSASVCYAVGLPHLPTRAITGTDQFLASTNGGVTWTASTMPASLQQAFDLSCSSATNCVVADSAGHSAVTDDGGTTWTVSALPAAFQPGVGSGSTCTSAGACVLTGSSAGTSAEALYSRNGGATWLPAVVPAGLSRILHVSCATDACVASAVGPGPTTATPTTPIILRSLDDGATWTTSAAVGLSDGLIRDVYCATDLSCTVTGTEVPAAGTFGIGLMAQTTDGGLTWTPVALPTLPSSTAPQVSSSTGRTTVPDTISVDLVSSVSCVAANACVALGSQRQTGQSSPEEVVFTSQLPAT
jgi:hypothetical protein